MEESRIENPILNELGVTDEEARQIGLRLQAKRKENPNSTLSDFAKSLKLNESYLEMIESGDWHSLPQSSTGRGFVRAYAKELGVSLPEFDKFFAAQTVLVASKMQTNLDKIIECARIKRMSQSTNYQRYVSHVSEFLFKLFTLRKNSGVSAQSTQPENTAQGSHKKAWLIVGSLSVLAVGGGVMTFLLADNDSSNVEIFEQPIADSLVPIINDAASQSDQNTSDGMIGIQADSSSPDNAKSDLSSQPEAAPTTPPQVVEPTRFALSKQKMQIDILAPVTIQIEADGKQVVNGLTQAGALNFEFQKKATLIIQDSSKVKLSYAGWNHEPLSFGARKRTIVLYAKRFADNNQ